MQRVGEIVAEHESAQSNGIVLADTNEVWYMEVTTSHRWVAQRIPDGAYAVCANRISIREVDFKPDAFIDSEGIREFAAER